eukprot:TRINITY_DN96393_c0_g1_i1.p1 TRINITY_DN96393_c0_g1~~TRINITY_DN96393_c0_g1_i1.p1  ORF type:complete len:202 (+),score=44.71 TRINITY_DN96393_c0_g1_i1:39-644(+)
MHAGAVGAAVGAVAVASRRHDRSVGNFSLNETQRLILKFDSNIDWKLQRDELSQLLAFQSQNRRPCNQPSDDELDFMLSFFDRRVLKMGSATALAASVTGENAVKEALSFWAAYMDVCDQLAELMAVFDESGKGRLDKEGLRNMLAMRDGKAVTDQDLQQVMQKAEVVKDGFITQIELMQVFRVWPAIRDAKKSSRTCTLL